MKIYVIDLGFGNVHSIQKAMQISNTEVTLINRAIELEFPDGIILPGVGAFGNAMKSLEQLGFVKALNEYVKSGKPLLGICLGMQLLFSYSKEFGYHKGLGLVSGKVVKIPKKSINGGLNYKIPHIGWNELLKLSEVNNWKNTILDGIKPGSEVYFAHSFVTMPEEKSTTLSYTNYGKFLFVSAIKKGNIYGCQFHPEKSREIGIKILQNFVKITAACREHNDVIN